MNGWPVCVASVIFIYTALLLLGIPRKHKNKANTTEFMYLIEFWYMDKNASVAHPDIFQTWSASSKPYYLVSSNGVRNHYFLICTPLPFVYSLSLFHTSNFEARWIVWNFYRWRACEVFFHINTWSWKIFIWLIQFLNWNVVAWLSCSGFPSVSSRLPFAVELPPIFFARREISSQTLGTF